jgi:hypothetical protein
MEKEAFRKASFHGRGNAQQQVKRTCFRNDDSRWLSQRLPSLWEGAGGEASLKQSNYFILFYFIF